MPRSIEELTVQEKQEIIHEILDKKDRANDKEWADIVKDYDLNCSSEVLRKLGAGVKFASDAGMKFDLTQVDKGFVERQKLYDIQRKLRQEMREFSRTELICEYIKQSIENLPKLSMPEVPKHKKNNSNRELVLGIGDFHYGADFTVTGLYNDVVNSYNSCIFVQRMDKLIHEITDIVEKENPGRLTIMIAGDMLDGLLRTSQLQRLEYGVIDSAIKLSETLTYWLISLEKNTGIPIRLFAVRGNHGEIRPLGTKAGQFPEENMERIVLHYLHARFLNEGWITLDDDAPMIQVVDVCGYQFLLTHGENTNIESLARDSVNMYRKSIDVFMIGHLHKRQSFVSGIMPNTNVYVERIPSICGTDPYAQSKGYNSMPGATAILMQEGYGIKCMYPINLN